jgi:HK97 family phage prohead protease
MNGSLEETNGLYNEYKFLGWTYHLKEWHKIAKCKEDVLVIHGEKRVDKMKEMREVVNQHNNLKILFLAPHLSTGGMPSVLLKRIQALEGFDAEIIVVEYSNHSDEYVVQKNEIKKLVHKIYTLVDNKMELMDIIKRHNIHLVHIEEMVEDSVNNFPVDLLNDLYDNNRTWKVVETCHNVYFKPDIEKKYQEMRQMRACNIQRREAADNADAPHAESNSRTVYGYAMLYDTPTVLWEYEDTQYVEVIERGAATEALKSSDIRALFNHNPNYILARTSSNTLTVREDEKGLYFEFEAPETSTGNDLLVSIQRGDISQASFAFDISERSILREQKTEGKEVVTITIKKMKELYDVSPVTYPAYKDTEVSMRSMITDIQAEPKAEQPNEITWAQFADAAQALYSN